MKNRIPTVPLLALSAACALAWSAQGQNFRHITIDGDMSDWAGLAPVYSDPQDSPTSLDYKDIYVANDENYLYIRFTIYPASDATYMNPLLAYNNLFIDTDATFGTGYPVGGQLGSEMFIQGGNGYQQDNGNWNMGTVDGLNWSMAPTPNGTAADFELRISRSATYHTGGAPVFSNGTIALMFEAENTGWSTVEVAPDWATYPPLTYTFASAPPPLIGSNTLVSLGGANWQANDAGTDLGSDWLAGGYDDTQAGWSAGQGLFGFTTQPGSWPTIQKSLSAGANTYYFRTHFQWNYDPGSAVFVVTNYLSDGAVYYLNGVEARRVRMPSGTIGFATSATSANPTGVRDVFGLPSALVFAGDNVLEVETHQAAGSSTDMVFGLSLTAASEFAPLIVRADQPADRTVISGQSTTFSAEVLGHPLAYQWLKNGAPLSDATNATYSIDPVLSTDAANYALQVSNSLGTATSRAAVLTVTVLPVSLDDLTQPADLTIAQGQQATFAVSASGSELQYQWRKGTTPIPDATNATYTLAAALLADAGTYACTVSNPVSSTNSRAATLTVVDDVIPPTLVSASGAPNKVLVTFSEAVDATTANNTANYSLSGGLSVLTATRDAANPQQVVLTTSAQTRGAAYVLTVNNVRDLFNNSIAANSRAAFNSTIIVDGSPADWQGLLPLYSGASNNPAATNFKDIWVFNDAQYIYFRLTTWNPTTFFSYNNNLFFDGDNNPASGYVNWGGSEMLVQHGNGYQEKNGGFNEGDINNLGWACEPTGSDTNFEFRISRGATYASDGGKVFTTNVINFIFDGEVDWVSVNRAPASGTLSYTLVEPEPLPLGPLSISAAGGNITVSWPGAGTLQSCPALTGSGWTNVPTSGNTYVSPIAPGQRFFRLVP